MNFNITIIPILLSLVSVVLVLLASIRLIRVNGLPGSKLIFIAVVGYVLSAFLLPDSDAELGEEGMLIQILTLGADSLLMLLATYGFYSLANHISKNAR